MADAMLFVVCGKAASGKSTLCKKLQADHNAVVLAEDAWLSSLFGDQMKSLADYVTYSQRLRSVMSSHIADLLNAGTHVVLDFPANTLETRAWSLGIAKEASIVPELHFLDVPDDICKARLKIRNESGSHPFTLSEEQFDRLAKHFVPPSIDEGFTLITHLPE